MKKKKVLTTAIVTTLALAGGIVFATSNINVSSSILSADSEEPYSFTLTKDTTPFAYDSSYHEHCADVDLGGGYLRRVRADSGRLDSNYLIVLEENEKMFTAPESEEFGILDNNGIVGLQKIEMTFHITDSELEEEVGSMFTFSIVENDAGNSYLFYDSIDILIDSTTEFVLSYNIYDSDCRYFEIAIDTAPVDVKVSSLTVTYTCA